jgi:hypothetical protein
MFAVLHLRHHRDTAGKPRWALPRARDFIHRRTPPAVADHDASQRDELAIHGLCDAGPEGPASLHSLDALGPEKGLEAVSLVRTGARRPKGQETLADASPYDLLGYLGLLG